MSHTLEHRPSGLHPDEQRRVEEQLQRIIASPVFRSSPRSQHLLTFIVTNAVAGCYESLKERVLGTEVFGRSASYDTSDDSIVRVRANDVRRRLAQYYDGAPGRDHEVRILLPTGAYVPEFTFPDLRPLSEPVTPEIVSHSPVSEPRLSRRRNWGLMTLVVGACFAALAGVGIHRLVLSSQTAVDRFWAPVIASPEPAIFCLGHAQVFTLSRDFRDSYFRAHPRQHDGEPAAVHFPAGQAIRAEDLVSVQGQFVGVGGAQAVQILSNLLALKGKPSTLRVGSDLSYSDLRTHPTILIGAFSNRWTLHLNHDMRFYFDEDTGEQVRDRRSPAVRWKVERDVSGRETMDYAVVTRLIQSESGQVEVDASGITQYGCRAAAELLVNDSLLRNTLDKLRDWEHKNLQVVLRSKIVGMTAGPPEVIASYSW